MNGQQLKNSILQWAIQGKLVPQDPNEGTVEDLLKDIRAEKERLVKAGKLKKKDLVTSNIYKDADGKWYETIGKETTEITDDIPFDVPDSWKWCRMGCFINLLSGQDLTPDRYFSSECGIPYITGASNFDNSNLIVNRWTTSPTSVSSKGDLLITCKGTVGTMAYNNIGDIHIARQIMAISTYISSIKYVEYFLQFMVKELEKQAHSIIPGISREVLLSSLIPLPPLSEQRRIVAKIEELMPLVEKYGKSQEKLDKLNEAIYSQLEKSILQEAIQGKLVPQLAEEGTADALLSDIRAEKERLVKEGKLSKKDLLTSNIYKEDDKWFETTGKETKDITEEIPFDVPDGWSFARIKDLFIINPKVEADDYLDAAFMPMEKIDATYGSSYSYSVAKWGTIRKSFTQFADGDVAFAKITPCFQNRKSMILKDLPNGIGAGTTELKVLRQYGETIDRWYLLFFLESPYFVEEAVFKGTANQQRIISGYLENKIFPLPPLAEQHRIVAKIEELMKVIKK